MFDPTGEMTDDMCAKNMVPVAVNTGVRKHWTFLNVITTNS